MLEGVLVGFLEDDFVGLNVGNIVGFNVSGELLGANICFDTTPFYTKVQGTGVKIIAFVVSRALRRAVTKTDTDVGKSINRID